ncbi:diguanylate cyclase domain-containing protein [Thalassotalea sediminis]|uniref:diguanylate cyclase domain-containing protein n=1 Tax=Thalassotalea sediminis TaxID=1759089 RepID=UPI0025736928|nr:diguanylate cyclase [Thalassotalea sediminis]
MNFTLIFRHRGLLAYCLICLTIPLCLSLYFGDAKQQSDYKWTDIIGEGSVALLTIFWLFTALASRPPGKVTRLLVLGLACFMFSSLLDLLDEFFRYQTSVNWLSVVESFPAAVGMIIMTAALYHWHLEQMALNKQLQRRELAYRAVDKIDMITQLYRADYWRERVKEHQRKQQTSAIIALDINNFTHLNAKFGNREGDRLLHEIAHLILMNLRPIDLACRYAGDRFIVLLPNADQTFAQEMASQIEHSIKHVAFRSNEQTTAFFQSVRTAFTILTPSDDLKAELTKINIQLDNESSSLSQAFDAA